MYQSDRRIQQRIKSAPVLDKRRETFPSEKLQPVNHRGGQIRPELIARGHPAHQRAKIRGRDTAVRMHGLCQVCWQG